MITKLTTYREAYEKFLEIAKPSFEDWLEEQQVQCGGCELYIEVDSDDVSESDYILCSKCVADNT